MILLLDNHDSFTWNLAQYMMELGAEVRVETNDAITAAGVLASGCGGIVISPGPGRPGPGEITIPPHPLARTPAAVIASFVSTRTSAPSSIMYWARFQVNES